MVYAIAILVIIIDQITKIWADNSLVFQHFVEITSFFNLYLVYNKGISFSFFSGNTAYGPWLLSLMAVIICIGLIIWIAREKNQMVRIGLSFVLGGAIGNIIDRIRLGAVIDFLDFHYDVYHWPAFNIADAAICFGAFLIFLQLFIQKKDV